MTLIHDFSSDFGPTIRQLAAVIYRIMYRYTINIQFLSKLCRICYILLLKFYSGYTILLFLVTNLDLC